MASGIEQRAREPFAAGIANASAKHGSKTFFVGREFILLEFFCLFCGVSLVFVGLGGFGLVPASPGSRPFRPMSEYTCVLFDVCLIAYPLRSISASCLLSLGESSQAKDM